MEEKGRCKWYHVQCVDEQAINNYANKDYVAKCRCIYMPASKNTYMNHIKVGTSTMQILDRISVEV